jgi:glycerol-3-phosphate acyltransferase PlsX
LKPICIAIDAMGGDHGPGVTVPAALDAFQEYGSSLKLILVGDQLVIEQVLKKHKAKISEGLVIHHASEQVLMDESPAMALRYKKDSSMRVAINLVKERIADACVSAGNTGALMAIARFVLKTLPGIDRPAIIYSLPIMSARRNAPPERVRMLDLGANVDCTAEHLFQFAVMGSVLTQGVDGLKAPRVGLLNIGSEAIKGSEVVKSAAQLLTDTELLNYIGFVEGTDIYKGRADVIVCDGFVGNVALKTSEGLASMLVRALKNEFTKGFYSKLAALVAAPVLTVLKKKFDPSQYNGASLLGLNGIVVKSHGNATRKSYVQAIREARLEVENNIVDKIRTKVAEYLAVKQA